MAHIHYKVQRKTNQIILYVKPLRNTVLIDIDKIPPIISNRLSDFTIVFYQPLKLNLRFFFKKVTPFVGGLRTLQNKRAK